MSDEWDAVLGKWKAAGQAPKDTGFKDDHTTGTVSEDRTRILPEVSDEHRAYLVFVRQKGALQHKVDRQHPFSGCVIVGWTADEIRARFTRELLLEPLCVYRAIQLDAYLQRLALRAKGISAGGRPVKLEDYQGEVIDLPDNITLGNMVMDALGGEVMSAEALGEAVKSVIREVS